MDTLFHEEPENYNHPALYYMSRSINVMANVDAVYFTRDWHTARGCRIERQIAKEYGLKILDADFLEEPKEELVRTPIKLEKPVMNWNTTSVPLTNKEIDEIVEKSRRDIEKYSFGFDSDHVNMPAYDE